LWEQCKNAENAVNTDAFQPEMHNVTKHCKYHCLKAKQKKNKLQHFWHVARKKCGYLQCFMWVFTMFSQFQENVEGTKHCKKQCFGHFWAPKRWYLRSFRP